MNENNENEKQFGDGWRALCKEFGSEEKAIEEVVRQLRLVADTIEKNGRHSYPQIADCYLFEGDQTPCENGAFIDTIVVTLSIPWPG